MAGPPGPVERSESAGENHSVEGTNDAYLKLIEDIFLAIGSILLMKGLLEKYGIVLEPFALSVWAIPSAVAAFVIHGFRLWLLDRRLAARAGKP